ncbi:TraR/DksA C4-type zinc finger protein [Shewanella sp. GutDb-MelDb]|uniref:TraR/DksA C4-type zinc finger protein n=1 Tax=Shewanella sp. GutDb-MelDb TaxID=2058316 RepID=UPI000C79A88D|nr:TraR/DksA C4-type zinc finger protein [Shewanella sp. GutDb-MelDb]PKG57735.1 conjugal transfer protein TraR [Shewanella sp. GutDb-MelDb]
MDDADLAVKHEERAEARARSRRMLAKPAKPSASHCIECDDAISQARRNAVPGVELCIDCQTLSEKKR